jgi:hypothetical protein
VAKEYSSISRVGTTEPFELQISRGQISYHAPLFKFGFNSVVSNTEETIWDAGGIYTYPSSALAMTVTSAGGATDSGITVVVQGLDGNYLEVSEEVTLNASGVATTTQTFLRVFRAYVSGGTEPTGNITITNTATTYAQIIDGDHQTLMAVYTVPAGKTLYLSRGSISSGTEIANKFITGRLVTRLQGKIFRTQAKVTLTNGFIDFDWEVPLQLPEKTDIEASAVASSASTTAVSATFEGILIDNAE